MRRSLINQILLRTQEEISRRGMHLPAFASFTPADWQDRSQDLPYMARLMLGWDLTDYGWNDFDHFGIVLFTLRNGVPGDSSLGTPYAEKLLYLRDGQRLALHCHLNKTEDIINRGGRMFMMAFNSRPDGSPDEAGEVTLRCDGIPRRLRAGEKFIVEEGNSVTVTPGIYHIFGSEPGSGDLTAWEVSTVNDDLADNVFTQKVERFLAVEEDEPPLRLLCNEYRFLHSTAI